METRSPGDGGQCLTDAVVCPRLFPGEAPFQGDRKIKIISGTAQDHQPTRKNF